MKDFAEERTKGRVKSCGRNIAWLGCGIPLFERIYDLASAPGMTTGREMTSWKILRTISETGTKKFVINGKDMLEEVP